MVRRKSANATVQLNLRVTPQLFRELESRAKAHGITVSEEVRQTLEADQSLASTFANLERQIGDAVEHGGRKEDIERRLHCRAALGALLRGTYTQAEQLLLPFMTESPLRQLVRGGKA